MEALAVLEVYQAGELTVVGFGGREVLDFTSVAECRTELLELIQEHGCRTLAIDLTGVKIVPSSRLLGMLAMVHRDGVEVHLYNASERVHEVLKIMKLDHMLHLHDVNV
ncbi:MAG: STAS domain-containing protein [Planctomycetaceae bacterium]|nr:STAS domain-containing protein [Planctomycetaceae bacterium]